MIQRNPSRVPLLIPKAFSLSNAVVREDKLWFYSVGTADVGRPQKAGIDVPRNDWKYYCLNKGRVCLAVLWRGILFRSTPWEERGRLKRFHLRCLPKQGASMLTPLEWLQRGIVSIEILMVSVRFILRESKFYSYWFE